jgi:hypothetical protein
LKESLDFSPEMFIGVGGTVVNAKESEVRLIDDDSFEIVTLI